MAKEFQTTKVPVASHGLHHHEHNYPVVGTTNFMEMLPVYAVPLEKGESHTAKGGFFSWLKPLVNAAFVTGRYNFKAFFVPSKYIYRPYYNVRTQTDYYKNDGTKALIGKMPYTTLANLSGVFLDSTNGYVSAGTSSNYDIVYKNGSQTEYWVVSADGAKVLKILMLLGMTPTWDSTDTRPLCIMPLLHYFKLVLDYFWPNQYIGTGYYTNIASCLDREKYDYTSVSDVVNLLLCCSIVSNFWYNDSMFYAAWDNPAGPNTGITNPTINFTDITLPSNLANGSGAIADSRVVDGSNGTIVSETQTNSGSSNIYHYGVITKYLLDSVESLSLWMKRRQLSGARLLDRFLVSRGYKLSNDSAKNSFYLGQKSVEINVQAVENNTTTGYLGELAGKGHASTGNGPLEFSVKDVDDDGWFFVVMSCIPDSQFPIYIDPYNFRTNWDEFYDSQFDKLGVEGIPATCVAQSMNGNVNNYSKGKLFGLLNRYYADVQDRPRLVGDFCINSRGKTELESFHSFRLFPDALINSNNGLKHSWNFLYGGSDSSQYKRMFYANVLKEDGFLFAVRWNSSEQRHKLPLGDSYDWDDDEFNKKVTVVTNGSQIS